MKCKMVVLLIVFWFLGGSILSGLDNPDDFLGYELGSDGNLAHYDQILKYFKQLGRHSARIKTNVIGKTTLKNEMIMAVISSPETIENLERYRDISRKLSLAVVKKSEAISLASSGKPIVFITCNLHSSEIGSSQMAMKLLHKFAVDNSTEMNDILNKLIIILIPSVNPDGQIMVVEWYKKHKGTKYEGGSLPYLYHYYAGHDNNRDWFKMNLKETQNVTKELYFNWFPQILVDVHQMGRSGDRFFIPPFQDPLTPGVHPLVWRTINLVGSNIAYDLERLNFQGVASRGFFTGWWIGALDDTAWFHNIAGILFEAASVRMATPVYIEPEEVAGGESERNEQRMFSPNPWPGGWWRLKDIINYEFEAILSVIKTAARLNKELILNSYKMAADNINKGKTESPFAYILPKKQRDELTAEKFVRSLIRSGIEVYRLNQRLKLDQFYFEAGAFVVPLSQPYRSFIKNIFEKQFYPDLRTKKNEQPLLPYDIAGWTLPIAMGVRVEEINDSFEADLTPVKIKQIYARKIPVNLNEYIVFDSRFNNSYQAAAVLLKHGVKVWRNFDCPRFSKGSFLAKKTRALEVIKNILPKTPLIITSYKNLQETKFRRIKNFQVGLYQNWGHNMIEGWTRFVLDEFQINYHSIHPKDLHNKKFIQKYDVLVFAGAHKAELESGEPPKEWLKWISPLPPEYSQGIGEKGQKLLTEFLKAGKTMIFMGESCDYALEKFKMPVENIIEKDSKVICPGSYLEVRIKDSELTFGMGKKAAIFYRKDPVFETYLPRNSNESRRTPVIFKEKDLLLSGWLEGEKLLARKSLVVDFRRDKGRIILIGPDVIHRGHCEGTYKILFNALFSASTVYE